jgi:hypothetical protein
MRSFFALSNIAFGPESSSMCNNKSIRMQQFLDARMRTRLPLQMTSSIRLKQYLVLPQQWHVSIKDKEHKKQHTMKQYATVMIRAGPVFTRNTSIDNVCETECQIASFKLRQTAIFPSRSPAVYPHLQNSCLHKFHGHQPALVQLKLQQVVFEFQLEQLSQNVCERSKPATVKARHKDCETPTL